MIDWILNNRSQLNIHDLSLNVSQEGALFAVKESITSVTGIVALEREGVYRFDVLDPQEVVVCSQMQRIDSNPNTLTFTIENQGLLEGKLTRERGEETEGITLSVYDAAGGLIQAASLDAQGRFRIEHLPYGEALYQMTGEEGDALGVRLASDPGMAANRGKLSLFFTAEKRRVYLDLVEPGAVAITGYVVSEDGLPIPDAVVAPYWLGPRNHVVGFAAKSTHSDANGEFQISAYPEQRSNDIRLFAVHPDFEDQFLDVKDVFSGVGRQTIVMKQTGKIKLTLHFVDEEGASLPGLTFYFSSAAASYFHEPKTRMAADETGTATIPIKKDVYVVEPHERRYSIQEKRIDVRDATESASARIMVNTAREGFIAGVVYASDTTYPLHMANVTLTDHQGKFISATSTKENGSFQLAIQRRDDSKEFTLEVGHRLYHPQSIALVVEDSTDAVHVVLEKKDNYTIYTTIMNKQKNEDVQVSLTGRRPPQNLSNPVYLQRDARSTSFDNLDAEMFPLQLYAQAGKKVGFRIITQDDFKGEKQLQADLELGDSFFNERDLHFLVTDREGKPIKAATIELRFYELMPQDAFVQRSKKRVTDAEGLLTIPGFKAGFFWMTVTHPFHESVTLHSEEIPIEGDVYHVILQ
ncbi:MAG: hypothetical protein GC154_02535 [bacterium]|nr:hypothetical protein [bacterium]